MVGARLPPRSAPERQDGQARDADPDGEQGAGGGVLVGGEVLEARYVGLSVLPPEFADLAGEMRGAVARPRIERRQGTERRAGDPVAGMAVVMASSDLPEVVGLSHRAFVMRDGTFVGELDRDALDHPEVQESVFRMATALEAKADQKNQEAAS